MFENSGSYNSRVTNVGYGENKYKWTISYGSCTTNDEVIVTSNKAKPYAGEDEVTYESFFDLQGSNPGKLVGEWSVVAGTGTFDDKNFFNATVSGMSGGMNTYRWTIETDGCIAFDDVTIDVITSYSIHYTKLYDCFRCQLYRYCFGARGNYCTSCTFRNYDSRSRISRNNFVQHTLYEVIRVVAVTDTDIKCYGSSNGEINVQISSGTAPYTVKLNGTPNDGSPFSEQTSNLTNKTFGKLKPA